MRNEHGERIRNETGGETGGGTGDCSFLILLISNSARIRHEKSGRIRNEWSPRGDPRGGGEFNEPPRAQLLGAGGHRRPKETAKEEIRPKMTS